MNKLQDRIEYIMDRYEAHLTGLLLILATLVIALATVGLQRAWLREHYPQTAFDPSVKPGVVYIFEKDGCKDCEAVIPELESQHDKNVEFKNVKYCSKEFLEKYNITDVPCGIVLKSGQAFVNLSLYTSERETDWNNYNRLKTLAKRYRN